MVWSFKVFDSYRWDGENQDDETPFRYIAARLREQEDRTWKTIEADKKRYHSEPKNKLSKQARNRLQELRQDDIDELWRFRFTGLERLWGTRTGDTFNVLWWDPKHKARLVAKKNT